MHNFYFKLYVKLFNSHVTVTGGNLKIILEFKEKVHEHENNVGGDLSMYNFI